MLLIYNPAEGGPPPEQMAEEHQKWVRYEQDLKDAGLLVANHGLRGVDAATTVRVRDDETQINRWPVRRDQGVPRRLLPHRSGGSRHRPRVRRAYAEQHVRIRRGSPDLGMSCTPADRRSPRDRAQRQTPSSAPSSNVG
jgi:hypothetical protein